MNRIRRLLLLPVAFTVLLAFAVTAALAARHDRGNCEVAAKYSAGCSQLVAEIGRPMPAVPSVGSRGRGVAS